MSVCASMKTYLYPVLQVDASMKKVAPLHHAGVGLCQYENRHLYPILQVDANMKTGTPTPSCRCQLVPV